MDTKVINLKGELVEAVIDILETGFENKTGRVVLAWSILADGVGELVVGRGFFTGGDVKVTPVDDVGGRFEVLS